MKKRVCVIGLGYIGLPTAAILAKTGYIVHGVDVKEDTVTIINNGSVHFEEPGLEEIIKEVVHKGNLRTSRVPAEADVFIICVPTPIRKEGSALLPDISYILSAAEAIAPYIRPGNYVVLESTSPLGTTEKMKMKLEDCGVNTNEIYIAYCPERIIPGEAIKEFVENDRIIGGMTETATEKITAFYTSFVSGQILGTNSVTAEMVKLTENSFRDVNIAFANELSLLAANAGVNVWKLIELANHHPRVNILQPGTGVGGHCIAVDPWFLVAGDPENASLITAARRVNDNKTQWVIDQIKDAAFRVSAKSNTKVHIAVLGLAFKADVDDLRESPAVKVAEELLLQGYIIHCVEPHIRHHDRLPLCSIEEALKEADIVAVLVRHRVFNFEKISKLIQNKVFLNFVGEE